MKITLSLDLDDEQTAALDGMVSQSNEADGGNLTPEIYLQGICLGLINNVVDQNIQAAGQRLIEASKLLPFADRIALTAQVESMIGV